MAYVITEQGVRLRFWVVLWQGDVDIELLERLTPDV